MNISLMTCQIRWICQHDRDKKIRVVISLGMLLIGSINFKIKTPSVCYLLFLFVTMVDIGRALDIISTPNRKNHFYDSTFDNHTAVANDETEDASRNGFDSDTENSDTEPDEPPTPQALSTLRFLINSIAPITSSLLESTNAQKRTLSPFEETQTKKARIDPPTTPTENKKPELEFHFDKSDSKPCKSSKASTRSMSPTVSASSFLPESVLKTLMPVQPVSVNKPAICAQHWPQPQPMSILQPRLILAKSSSVMPPPKINTTCDERLNASPPPSRLTKSGEFHVGQIDADSKQTKSIEVDNKLKLRMRVTNDLHISLPPLTQEQYDGMVTKFKSKFLSFDSTGQPIQNVPDKAAKNQEVIFLHERYQSLMLHAQVIPRIVFISDSVDTIFFTPKGEDTTLSALFARESLTPCKFKAVGKYRHLSIVLSWVNKSLVFYRGHYLRFRYCNNTLHININDPPHLNMRSLVHAALFDWMDLTYECAMENFVKFIRRQAIAKSCGSDSDKNK